MDRSEIIRELKQYFKISELVGSKTNSTYGERAFRFFGTNILHALLIVRENIGNPITVNGRGMEQRGLRTNIQPIVKSKSDRDRLYISAHIQGRAFDFDVKGMTAQEVRDWIVANENLFPFKIRLEDGVTWVHMDDIDEEKNPKVYLFNP